MEKLSEVLLPYIKQGRYHSCEWKIIHKKKEHIGKLGYMDIESKKNIKQNSLYRVWSMTKPIISIVVMQLVEEKKIFLEDPITKYLSEFSNLKVLINSEDNLEKVQDIKTIPTIKNLLMHTAGFSYNFAGNSLARAYDKKELFYLENISLEEEIYNLSKFPLLFQPSSKWHYSIATDVLARIIEVVSNNTLGKVLKSKLFDPLNMNETNFFIDEDNFDRLVSSYEYNLNTNKLVNIVKSPQKISNFYYPKNNYNYFRGGIGLFSTLNDYSSFSQMLLTGKSYLGKQILSSDNLNLITKNNLDPELFPLEISTFDQEDTEDNEFEPYGWGLGFRVMMDLEKANGIGQIGEFGWSGAASTYFLVDRENELTAVLMTQVLGGDNSLRKDFVKFIYDQIQ